MTRTDSPFDTFTDEQEFNALLRAADDEIDPTGSWVCRNDPPYPDWGVTVIELRNPPARNEQ